MRFLIDPTPVFVLQCFAICLVVKQLKHKPFFFAISRLSETIFFLNFSQRLRWQRIQGWRFPFLSSFAFCLFPYLLFWSTEQFL